MHLYIKFNLMLLICYASILSKMHFLEEIIIHFVIQFPIIKNFVCKITATDGVMCKEGIFLVTKLKETILDGSSISERVRDKFLRSA